MGIIQTNIDKINKLCVSHKVDKLYVFGSVVSDSFNPKSDIDLLVSFQKIDLFNYFDNYLDLKNKLEKLLKRKVDLVEEQTLKNPVLIRSIDRNKQQIYG
ncbi:nucleotidyltransferase domain-containing protein [uncultured Algoriphagus sp.]|uniref:nucleotidyltransferase family protein n=1 Tax=uncultured Algoriphagus sp. TaxID=417365 RepID=UPI0030ECE9D3|tara:strand:+ start:1569 stop:1868 length:300 start_codon:yes stop_codon:yes gene_type:complete